MTSSYLSGGSTRTRVIIPWMAPVQFFAMPYVSGLATASSIGMNMSWGKPGTRLLLFGGLPWPAWPFPRVCPTIGDTGRSSAAIPIPRPNFGPSSSDRALACRTMPMPSSIPPPVRTPWPAWAIGPTIETIWFIMWCGRWQCSIQSPGNFALNSIVRAWATPTSTVFSGYQSCCGMRPPSVPVTSNWLP